MTGFLEVPKWLRCLIRENNTTATERELEAHPAEKEQEDPNEILKEKKTWNIAANVAAVFLAVACVFLHAYFA